MKTRLEIENHQALMDKHLKPEDLELQGWQKAIIYAALGDPEGCYWCESREHSTAECPIPAMA